MLRVQNNIKVSDLSVIVSSSHHALTHPQLFVAHLAVEPGATPADLRDLRATLTLLLVLRIEAAQLDDGEARILVAFGDAVDRARVGLAEATLGLPLSTQLTTRPIDRVERR